jgi:hypothetical protein
MHSDELEQAQREFFGSAGVDLQPIAESAWRLEKARLQGRRFMTVDLDAMAEPHSRNEIGEIVKGWTGLLATSSHFERFRLFSKAALAAILDQCRREYPVSTPRRISAKPSDDPIIRRCVRVLAMVHELHKAGYQRIRVLPMLSPSGCYWRAIITFADNVADDGFHIIDEDLEDRFGTVARYTSGSDNEYFGWKDAKGLSARELASLFLERFPVIASRGIGCDWSYAGWLTDVLGEAEAAPEGGSLIHLIQDWDSDPDYMRRWQPPPPSRSI